MRFRVNNLLYHIARNMIPVYIIHYNVQQSRIKAVKDWYAFVVCAFQLLMVT